MSRFSWRSIEIELPLSIFGFLVLVIGVLFTAAYFEVRRSRIETATSRLESVTAEFARLTEASARQRVDLAKRVADDPRIHEFLYEGGSGLATRTFLDSVAERSPSTAAAELYNAFGDRLATSDSSMTILTERLVRYSGTDAYIGPITLTDSAIVSETIAPVLDQTGAVHGYFVHRRRAASAENVRDFLSQLIGSDATFLVGNDAGGPWTDMVDVVPSPPLPLLRDSLAHMYERAGGVRRLGAARSVAHTPWWIVVEFPLGQVLAPARTFLTRLVIIALALVVVGAFGAWLVSSTLTRRLSGATAAAEAVAAGRYDQRIEDNVPDELGALAGAFNHMADNVENGKRELEQQVAARTLELNHALEDLRAAQAELVRSERLAILGQLSSGLGHELRNPLGVMSNAVYFLNAITGTADPRVTRYLTIIRDQVNLSEKIIGDLLDFARMKAPNRTEFPLADTVRQQLARLPCRQHLTIHQTVPDHVLAQGDPIQIGQAVFNLLTNACQAMEETGEGTLTISGDACPDGRVKFEITDTGCGIPPDQLGDIFEPLFTTRARGIGLGLALTRAFVTANDGEIAVSSEVGTGTTFSIWIPGAEVAVPA